MNGYVNQQRFNRFLPVPLNMAQTELRRGRTLTVARLELALGHRLVLRSLTVQMVNVLTPDAAPVFLNSALGLCSAGLYRTTGLTSPLALAAFVEQPTTTNPFSPCIVETPGTYAVVVSNNTSNVDLSVALTGAAQLFY